MKKYKNIISDLKTNNFEWLPKYKNIDQKIWINMEQYFDDDEDVKSALWCSYDELEDNDSKIGVIFLTSKRSFIIECSLNANRLRYIPYDIFNSKKIKTKFAENNDTLNYIQLDLRAEGDFKTFACPDRLVVDHFIATLLANNNAIEIDEIEKTDAKKETEDEKKDQSNKNINKDYHSLGTKKNNLHQKKENDKKNDKLVKKEVTIKKIDLNKNKENFEKKRKKLSVLYGSQANNKIWAWLFIIPFIFVIVAIIIICI